MNSLRRSRWIAVAAVFVMAGVGRPSWGPTYDTIHYGDHYWHRDLGVLTQRLDLYAGGMREARPFTNDPLRLEISSSVSYWYGMAYAEAEDEQKQVRARLSRLMGSRFVEENFKSEYGGWGNVDWAARDILTLAEVEGLRFSRRWAEQFYAAAIENDPELTSRLLRQSPSPPRAELAAFAWAFGREGDEKIYALVAFGKAHPDSPRKPWALIAAAAQLLDPERFSSSLTLFRRARIKLAEQLLWQVLLQHPQSDRRGDALGWMGFVHRSLHDEASATEWYLKQAIEPAENVQKQGFDSLKINLNRLDDIEAQRVGQLLRRKPQYLPAYVEYRVNYSDGGVADADTLWKLADDVIKTQGEGGMPPRASGYFASAAYWQGDWDKALLWAGRAVASEDDMARAIGRYVRGSVYKKKGRLPEAIREYRACLKQPSYRALQAGAMENLASCLEKEGRLGEALDLYFDLGYAPDVAYMLDIRMSPTDIERYIQKNPRHPKLPILRYSAAMRWLRQEQFDKARAQFNRISPRQLRVLAFLDDPGRFRRFDEQSTDQLFDPREVLAIWESLKWKMSRAKGSEVRAKAAYELASFFYKNRNLQLYNASLWQGSRIYYQTMTGAGYKEGAVSGAEFGDQLEYTRRHMEEHEALNHARLICLEILEKYPESEVAPQAAYRGALASDRLAGFNPLWYWYANETGLDREGSRLLELLIRNYPNHPLAEDARKYSGYLRDEGG